MSGAAKFRKSDARQFNKPIEFDHSLAAAQQQHGDPTARGSQGGASTLSSQLGLDSDSDGDEQHNAFAAALDSNRALERRGAGAEGSTVPWEEFAHLQSLYEGATEDLKVWQSLHETATRDLKQRSIELQESESRAQQVQQMGKSSLAIAQKGFEEKLKSLRKLASEQESALSEDERTIDSLRQTIAQLQRQSGSTGGASVDIASSEEVSSAAARKAERENAALRVELELANAQLAATQTEMLQLQQTAGASSTVPVAASSVVASAARSAVGDESVTAAVAAAVRAAEGDSDAALLKLAGEKQHLEEMCRQLDDLLKTKESEMEELKTHAKAKIGEAKKKMQDLIETAKKREATLKEKAVQRVDEIRANLEAERDAERTELESLRAAVESQQTQQSQQSRELDAQQRADAERAAAASSERVRALTDQLATAVQRGAEAEANAVQLRAQLEQSEAAKVALDADAVAARARIVQLDEAVAVASSESSALRAKLRAVEQGLSRSFAALRTTTLATTAQLRKEMVAVAAECTQWRAHFGPFANQILERIRHRDAESRELLTNYRRELKLRRDLFNQIQELKGNIRVFCRVRPLSAAESARHETSVVSFPGESSIRVYTPEKDATNDFEFDQVFHPGVSQVTVFEEVSLLVQSVLDGFNVSIFAYGQTGSGKTYTMEGPPDDRGVNHRALQLLFARSAEAAARQQVSYDIAFSMLEVFNESIHDLLAPVQGGADHLKVAQGKSGTVIVDLTIYPVTSLDEVLKFMRFGTRNRAVGRTDMNEHSSRSHLVVTVHVTSRNAVTQQTFSGKLHLIDLAGSERLSKSGAVGDRLKETQSINYSLSALGDVINARVNNNPHIPFRNSVLTQVLQDSLSNNSKTLMIVQTSPADSNVGETICSLRFAARARTVELGKAKKNAAAPAGAGAAGAAGGAASAASGKK